ncbi:DoxX family protein [Paenibacillus sp. GCM10027626]|uniref:DoxX family protein n=1 Tax=Paenibacillus sp. GCM10027626 TaxID=3273411 RepID=UPI003638D96C
MSVFLIIVQCFLIVAFLFSGMSKITGAQMQVQAFKHLNLPQWFRVVTGLVQLAGVVGLIMGFWDKGILSLAALLITCVMAGAVVFHARAKDPAKQYIAPIVLAIIPLILIFSHLSELSAILNLN